MSLSVGLFPWCCFCTSCVRMKRAGSLQKLLHLANAREALASGDLQQALNEADAAIAADPMFGAARTLRADIIARMNPEVTPDSLPSVSLAAPVAVAAPVAAAAVVPPALPVRAPAVAVRAHPPRRAATSTPAGVPIALGVLVIVGGVGVALLASGIIFREPKPVPPVAIQTPAAAPAPAPRPAPVQASDVTLPPPPREAAAVARVKPAVAESREPTTPINAIEWASPRLTHLNVRPRWRASALRVEDSALLRDLGQGIGELWVGKLTGNEDAIFVGGNIDASDWVKLRGSIKPTGVVWRIYSNRSESPDTHVTAAIAAGFSRVKKVRYSADYSGEQFALRRSAR
jgi:hypothetical protein